MFHPGLPLILASTSPYRRDLLARLRIPFEVAAPAYEEPPLADLSPPDLARTHSLGKARAVAEGHPNRVVVGSDQVAELNGEVLGKPATRDRAVEQLLRCSGRTVRFHTGVAVVWGQRETAWVEPFSVTFRRLTRAEIEAYVDLDRPLGSAGSFKIESLGIVLMERTSGRDFTSLIGLPLMALSELLAGFGVEVLLLRR